MYVGGISGYLAEVFQVNHSSQMQAVKFQCLAVQSQSQPLTFQHSSDTWAWLSTSYNLVIVKGVGFTCTVLRVGLHKGPRPKNLQNQSNLLVESKYLDPASLHYGPGSR